jgi:hypothetical protein
MRVGPQLAGLGSSAGLEDGVVELDGVVAAAVSPGPLPELQVCQHAVVQEVGLAFLLEIIDAVRERRVRMDW